MRTGEKRGKSKMGRKGMGGTKGGREKEEKGDESLQLKFLATPLPPELYSTAESEEKDCFLFSSTPLSISALQSDQRSCFTPADSDG